MSKSNQPTKKIRKIYIHTMDGRPARYYPGEQICFAHSKEKLSDLAVNSLDLIRKQQQLSDEWRKSKGLEVAGWNHDYLIIYVDL